MPVLPLDHLESFAATLGVMLFPGRDDSDRRMARAFAARYLAVPISRLFEAGHSLPTETLLEILIDASAGEEARYGTELEKRWRGGTACGEIVKAFVALSISDEGLASWSHAVMVAEIAATSAGQPGSRTALRSAQRQFMPVAHLWGAWAIREGQFLTDLENGYDGWTDFQFFLAESEVLREWGQNWRQQRSKAKPPFPTEMWHVPEGWRPPERRPGWPPTGKIPKMSLPRDVVAQLHPSGRPKKNLT